MAELLDRLQQKAANPAARPASTSDSPGLLDKLKEKAASPATTVEETQPITTEAESKDIDAQLEEAKAGYVTIPELQSILTKYNLPDEDLERMKEYAVFYGTKVPGFSGPKAVAIDVAGFLGELTGSFAQKYSTWKQPDAARGALDDLRELARSRKTAGRTAAEIGGSIAMPAGLARAATTPQKVMGLAAAGSIAQNVAQSRTGEELTGVTESITTGLGATGLLMNIGRLFTRRNPTGQVEVVTESGRKVGKEELEEIRYLERSLEDAGPSTKIRMAETLEEYTKRPDTQRSVNTMSKFLEEWKPGAEDSTFSAFWKAVTGGESMRASEQFMQDAKLVPYLTKRQARQLKKLGDEIAPNWWRESGGTGASWLAYHNHLKELGRLQRYVGAESLEDLATRVSEEGPEFMTRQYLRAKQSGHLRGYINKEKLQGLEEWSQFRKGINQISDVKPLARQFDAKFGSNFEQTIDSISERLNRVSYLRASALGDLASLRKESNRAGVSPDAIFHSLESGNATKELPQELYTKWRGYFDRLQEQANEMGLPIIKRENYAPNLRPDAVTYSSKMRNLYEGLGPRAKEALRGDDVDAYKRMAGITKKGEKGAAPEAQAIRMMANEMETLLGEYPQTPQDFRRMYGILRNPQSVEARMNTRARAAMARQEEGIPEYFKETNIYELAKQWTSNTFRHAAIRDELAELNQFKKFAQDQGDSWTVDYVDKLMRDITGTRTDVLGKDSRRLIKRTEIQLNDYAARLREEGKDWKAKQVERLTYIPEVYQMMAQSIYPNLLGLSPRAAFQNAISSPIMNIPELGANYGTRKAMLAAAKSMMPTKESIEVTPELAQYLSTRFKLNAKMTDAKRARLDSMVEDGLLSVDDAGNYAFNVGKTIETTNSDVILGAQGILPAQWTGELVSQLRNELKNSSTYQASANMIERWTQASMAMFEASERMARMQTYHLANEVADDLVAGRSGATSWLNNISSPSYSRAINNSLKEGNEARTKQLVQRYFQSTNMFNYDRANMSAYGRYMGPLFSTFSKWPTAIAGRVTQELYDRKGAGARKLGKQLLAPFILAAGVDAMLPTADESPERNVVLGQGGLKGITPLSSLSGFAKGEFATPPIAQAMGAVVEPLMGLDEDTPSRVSKGLQKGATMFVPGANLLKLTGETIPQMMGVNVRKENRSGRYKGRGKLEQQALRTVRQIRGMGRR